MSRGGADRGSVSVEVAILTPAFLLLIVLAIVNGRSMVAYNAIDLAAHDAARAASISRDAVTAEARARSAVVDTLDRRSLSCADLTVTVDTRQFALPVGQPAAVEVTVSCLVSFADVALPGVPASRLFSSSFTSPLDQFRSRT